MLDLYRNEDEDFKIIHRLTKQGLAINEIAESLNEVRNYVVDLKYVNKVYKVGMKRLAEVVDDNTMLDEKEIILQQIDWGMTQAIKAYRIACGESYDIMRQGSFDRDELEKAFKDKKILDEQHLADLIMKKQFVTIRNKRGDAEKAKFLDVYKSFLAMKAKILGVLNESGKVDITNILNQLIINDDSNNKYVEAITSETEVLNTFKEINFIEPRSIFDEEE